MTFSEWKVLFDKAEKTMTVDWDASHAYAGIDGKYPSVDEIEDQNDRYAAEEHEQDYLCENEPEMWCQPHPVSDDEIGSGCGCCDDLTGEDAENYVDGYLSLVKEKYGEIPQWDLKLIQWKAIQVAKRIAKS
jgi:hypothetical protein